MAKGPTKAQVAYLARAEDHIEFVDTDLPPARGHRWSTHLACERRGWVRVNATEYPHVVSLTDGGRAELWAARAGAGS